MIPIHSVDHVSAEQQRVRLGEQRLLAIQDPDAARPIQFVCGEADKVDVGLDDIRLQMRHALSRKK